MIDRRRSIILSPMRPRHIAAYQRQHPTHCCEDDGMNVNTRTADDPDLPFLREVEAHLPPRT